MSRFYSYINSAEKIIKSYDGNAPLVLHLKTFFSAHKQMGGRDRKMISKICYYYYRCIFLFNYLPLRDSLVNAFYLCEQAPNLLLENLSPELNKTVTLSLAEKLDILKTNAGNIFPFSALLSHEIDAELFSTSMLTQPDLYLRLRPGKEEIVVDKLNKAGIDFFRDGNCLSLPNSTKVNEIIQINKEAVVQDYSSQKVLDYLDEFSSSDTRVQVWDCCAASGGKSILLADKIKTKFHLFVSDIRPSIIANLQKRLKEAAVAVFTQFTTDLTKQTSSENIYDIVIADVPCTGSGTWSRTPEQMAYFKNDNAQQYATKQLKIATNAYSAVKPGGLFFYITCSVFKIENEDVIDSLAKQFSFEILQMKYLNGYNKKADSLFVAVLKKRL
ncbi:MAG: Fmu (Sun) domain-containing protein [Ferruginibacter sp.]